MPSAPPHDLSLPVRQFIRPVDTTLRADQTVADALQSLRQQQPRHAIVYFYAVDTDGKLVGVVPTRQLLLSDQTSRVSDLMDTRVLSLPASMTLEEALEEFAIHRLLALPVVDEEGRLLGTIDVRLYAEEVFDLAAARRTDEIFQFIGLSVEQARQGTPLAGFRLRMPWLACNLLSGVACAVVAAFFEDVLAAVVLLAMFIPLVLTLSESVAMQAMTIGLQFLRSRHVPWRAVRVRANVEWRTAIFLGLASGLTVGLASLLWGGGRLPSTALTPPAIVLSVAIMASMVLSAMIGLSAPALLHAWRLDPKLAAGPVVLMIADVLTTTCCLGLASWWLL